MTLIQAVTAYIALSRLAGEPLAFETAHKLMLLRRQLEPHYEFYSTREAELVKRYAGEDISPTGRFVISMDDVPAYKRDRLELNSVEVEDIPRVSLKMPEGFAVSALEVEALTEFIDFEGVE